MPMVDCELLVPLPVSSKPRSKPAEAPMADGTQLGRWHAPMSYLASPYRPWGRRVTYKPAAELEGFGIFPFLG